MRLNADDLLAGVPALQVRKLLRRWGYLSRDFGFIAEVLGVSGREARAVLRGLLKAGLLERDDGNGPREPDFYTLTTRGNAFAQASAAPPLRRATVEKRLDELVQRMVAVNASSDFLVGIEDAVVFGSYLRDTDRLGDLDISVRFFRKESDPQRFMDLARDSARSSGRHFNTFLDALGWPETKVKLFLKSRSRVFSIHVDEPLLQEDPTVPRRIIFINRAPA